MNRKALLLVLCSLTFGVFQWRNLEAEESRLTMSTPHRAASSGRVVRPSEKRWRSGYRPVEKRLAQIGIY